MLSYMVKPTFAVTRYRVTHRNGRVQELKLWGAVIRATRPGSVVEVRTREGWKRVEMVYGSGQPK